jgi:hypothetical protein
VSEGDRRWAVTRRHGTAAALHAIEVPDPASRSVWVLTPDRPALVLGSTQPDAVVATEAAEGLGVDVVRRRSGGGAVLLDPDGTISGAPTLWVDLVLPRADPLWLDDVGRSMGWLGDAWVAALGAFGVAGEVHRGALERTAASALVCFAGVGPGEVVADGRKVVGISQRRTRGSARFQCLVNLGPAGEPSAGPAPLDAIVALLDEPAAADERHALAARLRDRTAVVDATADQLVDALIRALPGAASPPRG